ncbi:MAG: UbiA family prenyltransferase [Desulfuromonadales bacterium]|nr:UbiA family prenyltransferase [Desulfuromonadales bacterium]
MASPSATMTGLTAFGRLLRLPLSGMVAVTALAGALAAAPRLDGLSLWGLFWAIFLLSAGCSVLNQAQERFSDALMTRTCARPLACGLIGPRHGTRIGLACVGSGLLLLLFGSGPTTALLGLFATAWYLLVYTPLKRVTSLAVLAGTPCGILPPLIGWQAGGAPLFTPQSLTLALILLLWQVPHFWLLALPDRDELTLAGFKVLPAGLSNQKILHLCHFWILGLASASLLLPLLGLVTTPLLQVLVGTFAVSFALWATHVQRNTLFIEPAAARLRLGLHLYLGLLFGTVLCEALLIRLSA